MSGLVETDSGLYACGSPGCAAHALLAGTARRRRAARARRAGLEHFQGFFKPRRAWRAGPGGTRRRGRASAPSARPGRTPRARCQAGVCYAQPASFRTGMPRRARAARWTRSLRRMARLRVRIVRRAGSRMGAPVNAPSARPDPRLTVVMARGCARHALPGPSTRRRELPCARPARQGPTRWTWRRRAWRAVQGPFRLAGRRAVPGARRGASVRGKRRAPVAHAGLASSRLSSARRRVGTARPGPIPGRVPPRAWTAPPGRFRARTARGSAWSAGLGSICPRTRPRCAWNADPGRFRLARG